MINNVSKEECNLQQLTEFLSVFTDQNILKLNKNSQLWNDCGKFVSDLCQDDFEELLQETKSIMEQKRSKNSDFRLYNIFAVGILFLSHHNFDPSLVTKFKSVIFSKNESNRAYDGERHQINDEEWSRPEFFALLHILRLFEKNERKPGRNYLSYAEAEVRLEDFTLFYFKSFLFLG